MRQFFTLLSLCLVLIVQGQSSKQIKAVHLINYLNDEALIELSVDLPRLSAMGINTIFLEVDYNFEFKSHPELIQSDKVISEAGAKKFAKMAAAEGIDIIPQFQSLGHQSWAQQTFKLLEVYPELDLTPGAFPNNEGIYCREWDVMNPKVNEIVFPLIEEIVAAFGSKGVHLGMDEVFLLGSEQSPSTKGKNTAELYAKVVNEFHEHFMKKKGIQLYMWGDRFIDAYQYGYGSYEASTNGTAPAIDMVPKDIIICDWHYNEQKVYPSIDLFLKKGFKVMGSSWKDVEAAKALVRYSYAKQDSNMIGHVFTTWGSVKKGELLDFQSMIEGLKVIEQGIFHEVFIEAVDVNALGQVKIKCSTSNPELTIRYTTDGSEPTIESNLYTDAIYISKSATIKAKPFKGTEKAGEVSEQDFLVHKAVGKEIKMITTPSDKYATEKGKKLLVNGVEYTASYSDGEWLGFEGNDAELVIDLGGTTKISNVSINFRNKVNDWIHHPNEVVLLGSTDGEVFTQIEVFTKRTAGKPIVAFNMPVDVEIRYLKVIAKNKIIPAGFNGEGNPAWMFMDEVVVE